MKLYIDPDIIVKSRRKGQANARYAATVWKKDGWIVTRVRVASPRIKKDSRIILSDDARYDVSVAKDATSDCLRSPSTWTWCHTTASTIPVIITRPICFHPCNQRFSNTHTLRPICTTTTPSTGNLSFSWPNSDNQH